jgi:hypothetical protein
MGKSTCFSRPAPTIETYIIAEFGIEFLRFNEDRDRLEDILDGFVIAHYPIIGATTFFTKNRKDIVRQNYRQLKTEESQAAFRIKHIEEEQRLKAFPKEGKCVGPATKAQLACIKKEALKLSKFSLVEEIITQTLRNLKKLIYIATVKGEDNSDQLLRWVEENLPQKSFLNFSWRGPGGTTGTKDDLYFWELNQEKYSKDQIRVLEFFGDFRGKFIEILIKSLSTRDNPCRLPDNIFKELERRRIDPNSTQRSRDKALGSLKRLGHLRGRDISNGEFYFASCPNCKTVFTKKKYDKRFCSRKCAVYYKRRGNV